MDARIGVVGLGNAARTLHLPALAAIRPAWVGGCDLDSASRDAAAGTGIQVFETLDALIEEGRADVVLICTPPESHAPLAIEALQRGAHVICEKPFATSVGDAERILEAARATGRRVALNHEFRRVPIYRALRDEIGTPEAGDLVWAQTWQTMDLPPWKEAGWRSDLLTSTLFEAGIHLLDYLVYLFGARPEAATAVMSSCGAHAEASDAVALVTLEFAGGRLGQLIQNRLCPGDLQYFEVRADCERASLRASFGGRARASAGLLRSTRPHLRWEWGASGIAWREVGAKRRTIARNPRDPAMAGTRLLLEETLRAFATGEPAPVEGEEGLVSIEVLAACYASAREGRRVELGPGFADRVRESRLV